MKRVLVIDDSADFCETLCELLSELGYEPTTAGDPEAAKAACSQKKFDLIFCDLVMPVHDEDESLDGIESGSAMVGLHAVHELSKLQTGVPVVAMSGQLTGEPLAAISRFGAVAALSKPFGLSDLQQVLNQVFNSGN